MASPSANGKRAQKELGKLLQHLRPLIGEQIDEIVEIIDETLTAVEERVDL